MKLTRSNGKKEKRKWRTCPLLGNMLDITSNMRASTTGSVSNALSLQRAVDTEDSGKEPWIVVSSVELFEAYSKLRPTTSLRGPVSQYQSFDVLGNGLSVSTTRYAKIFKYFSTFLRVRNAWQTFGIKKELSHFTMDVFSKIGFGVELDTLKDTFDREETTSSWKPLMWLPWRLLKKFLNVGWEKILMDNCKNFHDFIDSFILKAIEDRREKKVARDLISLFLESRIDPSELDIKEDEAQIMRDMTTTFINFGSGPHICLGMKCALMETKLTLVTLFSKFDVKTVEDPREMTYDFSLTIPVKGPMDVQLSPLSLPTCLSLASSSVSNTRCY
ncbi:Cytochrome P450, conserved site [Phytophthora cactorum]|nr:Cytochrome P450, conserved site [Phytophthora cactorum]